VSERSIIRRSDGSVTAGTTTEPSDWELTIAPRELSFIRIDHQARLQFDDTEIVIEGEFSLEIDGVVRDLDPEEREKLGPFLGLYPDTLTAAAIDPDGTLRLSFGRGPKVTVPPDPRYEPWQINGPGTALIVCMPGELGKLAIWT
jgi:hypothetical protein